MRSGHSADGFDPSFPMRASRVIAALVITAGGLNWLGWATGVDGLTRFAPGWLPMRPWTALWLAALATAILLQTGDRPSRTRCQLSRLLGLGTALLAIGVLCEYRWGSLQGFDLWWFGDAVRRSPLPLPGRPSEQTAVPAAALGVTVSLLRVERRWAEMARVMLIAFGAFVPAVAVFAGLFGSSGRILFSESVQIAPTTAGGLLLVVLAAVLARPDRLPMAWFMSRPDPGSLLRLLVVLLGFPFTRWSTETVLEHLGADARTGRLFSDAFSTIVVAIGVFVVSRRQQQLLMERVALAEHLREVTDRYRLLAENASDLVFSVSAERMINWVSPSVTAVLGYSVSELLGRPRALVIHPDDLHILEEARPTVMDGARATVRLRLRSKSGADVWCELTARRIPDTTGADVGVVASVRDISAEVAAQAALQRELAFDGLTGLPRKELALQRIREMQSEHAEDGIWLLCVGVNGMTSINQAYTYTAGDAVLQAVAQRLVDVVGAHDRVARIAGDEFVVMKPDVRSPTAAAAAAEAVLTAVRGPLVVGGATLHVTASIGIAVAQGDDAEELLRDATAAMRQAARKGPDRWEFLDGNVGAQTREALYIQGELRAALATGHIEPWFMPVVELPGRHVVGFETLARWRREDGSIWAPDLFLQVAERSGLIGELDRVIFRQAVEALRCAPAGTLLSYNVSATSLASDAFAGWIAEVLAESGVDPRQLKFEITETSIFQVTSGVKATMHALAALGIDWWVDDFGTGFSSISHLRDLPIAGLKLDRSFTADIDGSQGQSEQLAEGLLGLARGLQLAAIAEGVETEEQEAVLVAQGWRFAQGWLYGRPIPRPW